MWSIDPSAILILIPIVFVGIIVVAVIGSQGEKSRGDRIARFFSIASDAALFFTVLALLYQVIDSQEQSRHDAYSQLLDTYSRIDQMQLDHPEIFEVIYPGDVYNRIGEEERLAQQYTYAVLDFFNRVYMLHLDGGIDDSTWAGWRSWIDYTFTASDYFRRAWDENCVVYHAEFVAYIENTYGDGVCAQTGRQVGGAADLPATPDR
jgi:hypothetical protein